METLEVTKGTVVNFSKLNSLANGRYLIERSDDPTCIYKKFTDIDNKSFVLNVWTSGFLSNKNISAQLTDEKTNNFGDGVSRIMMLVDVPTKTIGQKENHGYPKIVVSDGSGSSFSFDLNYHQKGKIVEKDGDFFIDYYGVLFPNNIYGSNRDIENITNLYYSMQLVPAEFSNRDQKNRFLKKINTLDFSISKTEGIAKTFAGIKPFYDELKDSDDILSILAFKMVVEGSSKTINNVKFSVAFNKIFSDVKTKEDFDKKIKELSTVLETQDSMYSDYRPYLEAVLNALPEARDIKKAALKRKSTGAFNKIMDDLDFVNIDEKEYPLTHAAVFSGELPIGTFFRKNEDTYFVYNDNWQLWEEMLKEHPEIAKEIAHEASKRTTYEKDIMSYFYFVLHALPEYLKANTGKKWKGIPKLVTSENELDPPTEDSVSGTAKSRSALTPIVDNEKNEVVVPYVSMRLAGYSTTYCYGLDYNILTRGVSFLGNAVTKDVEKKLNGRDDYGLMFYTLTGSSNGRGYPTFLIIFERLEKSTRVHFHRTHPMRSKKGDYNPIHSWTIGCYKWMIGNVNFDRIKAQQGDLAFVETTSPLEGEFSEVNSYDNHMFSTPVKFLPYEKKDKQNVLGYVRIEKETTLNHNEHMARIIPPGDYEIRQCRSWEANPKGVWSLRID